MERVTFLLEASDRRIACLINPDALLVRRSAGIERRRSLGGDLSDPRGADDPLLFTGGGLTELVLELLFDVGLAGSSLETQDVRALTSPLWALSENIEADEGRLRPPTVRFVWGKAWNVPGIVADVSERLERFDAGGVPSRSWLKMRLLRSVPRTNEVRSPGPPPAEPPIEALESPELRAHQVTGTEGGPRDRLDELAGRYYGDPSWWRVLAQLNDVDDPLHVAPGTVLAVPPVAAIQRRS